MKKLFIGCLVLVGIGAAGIAALNMMAAPQNQEQAQAPANSVPANSVNVQKATIVEAGEVGPLEKAGRVADELIGKAGLSPENVEDVAETAKVIGEKAAEKAEVALEKVKETATKAIVKAEELADQGKDAALEAADNLGENIKAKAGTD